MNARDRREFKHRLLNEVEKSVRTYLAARWPDAEIKALPTSAMLEIRCPTVEGPEYFNILIKGRI